MEELTQPAHDFQGTVYAEARTSADKSSSAGNTAGGLPKIRSRPGPHSSRWPSYVEPDAKRFRSEMITPTARPSDTP